MFVYQNGHQFMIDPFLFFLWVCVARTLDKSSTKRFYLKFFMNFKHYSFLFIYFKYIIWYIYAIIIANEPPHISIPSIRQRKQENLECPFILLLRSPDLVVWICYMRQDAIIYPRTFTEETWQFSKWISTWHWSTPCTHSLCKQSLTLGLDKEYVQPLWFCRRKSRSSLIID